MIKNRLIDPLIAHVRRHPMRSALLVLLTAATSAAFWQSDNASIPQQPQAQWVQVQPQLVEQQLGLVGRIQAALQETLSAPFEGVIRDVLVQEGQTVEAGQTLLRGPVQSKSSCGRHRPNCSRHNGKPINCGATGTAAPKRHAPDAPCRPLVQRWKPRRPTCESSRALFERGIVARMEVDTLAQQVRTQQQDLLAARDQLRTAEVAARAKNARLPRWSSPTHKPAIRP